MSANFYYFSSFPGFFTLNNVDAPGNSALYDMVEALRWVSSAKFQQTEIRLGLVDINQ